MCAGVRGARLSGGRPVTRGQWPVSGGGGSRCHHGGQWQERRRQPVVEASWSASLLLLHGTLGLVNFDIQKPSNVRFTGLFSFNFAGLSVTSIARQRGKLLRCAL